MNKGREALRLKILKAPHQTTSAQHQVLEETVNANRELSTFLDRLDALGVDGWVGAGVVAQNVWNVTHHLPWNHGIKDLDLLFFEPQDLRPSREAEVLAQMPPAPMGLELDVVNVARIHQWYEQSYGVALEPYESVAASIATWPVFASSVAVRRRQGRFEVLAPFGLYDLFAHHVRPNKVLITQEVYDEKSTRWKRVWPELKVEAW